jgi:hypothetical protein
LDRDFALEHQRTIFVERATPKLGAADGDIGDGRRDGDRVLLQLFDAT